ncbi:MAG: hypothetical protein GY788_26880 [bacterium]|nr:hypothetical protein [bacterium]
MDNERVVISAPRCGLNWLRICVEFFCMIRTHGKPLLIPKVEHDEVAFWRTHDATGVRQKTDKSWGQPITVEEARGRTVVLLIRDPRELFGRAINSGKSEEKGLVLMQSFVGNLNVFGGIGGSRAKQFYYDDYVTSPNSMVEILEHLGLTDRTNKPVQRRKVNKFWQPLGALSRKLYTVNHPSGSMTKKDPTNMKAHQSVLRPEHVDQLRRLFQELTPEARTLLSRYDLNY